MNFNMPAFEIKHHPKNDWERVSEKLFVTKLIDSFEMITPVLDEMFQGKEITAHDCLYRIKRE
jgi:hypothetical protein